MVQEVDAASAAQSGRGCGRAQAVEVRGEALHGGELVGVADRDGASRGLPDFRHGLCRNERVTAEVQEEVRGGRDVRDAENLGPHLGDETLTRGSGADRVLGDPDERANGLRECAAVHLPARRPRKLVDDVEEPGDHVWRNPRLEQREQFMPVDLHVLVPGDDVRSQLLQAVPLQQADTRRPDLRVLGEHGLDL